MKVIVIGAGAAGLMAAGQAAANGAEVTVLEKNDRPGRKLLITGKGRCNITNTDEIRELIKNIPGNGQFLYSAFSKFGNWDLISFLNENGLPTKEERGGRVFPVSDKAQDVVETLVNYCVSKGVEFRYNAGVTGILAENQQVTAVKLKNGSLLSCDAVILAAGGASYPGTGSTGDGYRMAAALGHTIVPLKPSLIPLETEEEWVKELQGLALKNVEATVVYEGGKAAAEFGEMLFTHFGVSGPVILTLSRIAAGLLEKGGRAALTINLKPALSPEQLDSRIQRDFSGLLRKQYKNSLGELLPKSLIPVIIKLSGISGEKPVHQITREERLGLVRLLQGLTLNIRGLRPLAEAIVTAGGISVKEINPKTMESKLIKGLFPAGEVVDVDGYTGGYNLQAAFSMGFLAGINAAGG
ncbi:NAD(P)/FAD-dependent oxidoreductase [Phosphitispora fastidiosa]|uniref:NAD(P)/FAD-dependent oxidoreductase n=1 Tax=Phosphitispora fastidiosa TaxID=2837202 RepID=UPI001E5CC329|nr:NAD(P)/FAD-dependent oxidoreductase [Phosphitispora fastidiosa]MBU7005289.1 putative Rossmann fold flavoprotein [Phosphitispora fastidiosa]